jgi:uncharacterized protein with PIN domain
MIIDTSALLAILFDEPDGPALLRQIAEAPIRYCSRATTLVRTLARRMCR